MAKRNVVLRVGVANNMETKNKVVDAGKAVISAIGKSFVRLTANERETLTVCNNIGADSFNGYLPRVRVDEVILAIAIENSTFINETAKTATGETFFYLVTASNGEIHGGECETFNVTLNGSEFTVLWHAEENTFVLLGMIRELQLLSKEQLLGMIRKGECYDVQTTLPKDNYFDGQTGLLLKSGILIGEVSKTRQALGVMRRDGSLGILDLHSGKRHENERCNSTGFAGVTDANKANAIRFALGIAKGRSDQKETARRSESAEARKARRTRKAAKK